MTGDQDMNQIQIPTEQKIPFTGEMAIMGREGDTKVLWDKTKPIEVEVAKITFDKLIKDGYSAYAVSDTGDKKGSPVREFDSNAERLIFIPPMQAG